MAKIAGNNNRGGSQFERHIFDEGLYDMKLVKVMGYMRDATTEVPDPKPALMMIWSWCDDNGVLYQKEDGQTYDLVDYLGMPHNFSYNDKSAYWKRLSEISGFAITKDTVELTAHDFGEFITCWDDVMDVISNPDPDKPEKKGKVTAESLEVNAVEQLGRVCKVAIKKVPGKKDPSKFFNNIGSVMQAQAAAPKRPPARAAQPTAAPQQQAPASRPPARPATPAPAPAGTEDLPY
ncbi:hypothetical protein [Deinococcus sp. PEB2-63]